MNYLFLLGVALDSIIHRSNFYLLLCNKYLPKNRYSTEIQLVAPNKTQGEYYDLRFLMHIGYCNFATKK